MARINAAVSEGCFFHSGFLSEYSCLDCNQSCLLLLFRVIFYLCYVEMNASLGHHGSHAILFPVLVFL